jgi:prolipoprotein diacylglyceryltransferase
MIFPFYVSIWGRQIHPHVLFDLLAYAVGFAAYLLLRGKDKDFLSTPLRLVILAAATTGAAIGAKLLFVLEDPSLTLQHLHDPVYLLGGKTIVGALAGGLIAVELTKRYVGIDRSTGDLFAIPLALGIAIGRIGCFLTGLTDNTYGVSTSLPWGVDFGDGVRRHPTQVYEAIFLFVLTLMLRWIMRQINLGAQFLPGDAFQVFMVAYMGFRLLSDFIKPYPQVALGLGAMQWVCLLILLYYAGPVWRWLRITGVSLAQRESNSTAANDNGIAR